MLFLLFAVQVPALADELDAPTQTEEQPVGGQDDDQNLLKATDSTGGEKGAVTQEDIAGLKNEIDVLREQWQRKLDKGTVLSTRNLMLNGNFQVRYGISQGKNGGFSIPQVQFGFKGNLFRDYDQGKNVDYSIGLTTDKGNFSIIPNDIYLSYNILPSLDLESPYLKVTLGQQKKVFGLEATAADDKKPTINLAQFASALKLNER
ncbi:MAG TPA: hypothetical protein VF799_03550, partial [Geobacteraceae bacterium]